MGFKAKDLIDRLPRFAYIPGIQPSDSVAPPLGPAVPPGLETED